MKSARLVHGLLTVLVPLALADAAAPDDSPGFVLRPVPAFRLPGVADPKLQNVEGGIDCNNPSHWDGSPWYPQVIGTDAAARETDKRAGRTARLFLRGLSEREIVFLPPGEAVPPPPEAKEK